jgi:linoleoyl-CoA desaturase
MRYAERSNSPFFTALRQEVERYFQSVGGNRLATPGLWLKALAIASWTITCFALLLFAAASFTAALLCYAGFGIGCLLLTLNLSHDAAHDALTRKRWLNRLIHRCVFGSLGVDARLWQMRHVHSHHLYPNINGCDADIDHNPLIRLSPNHPWKRAFRYQHFYAPLVYLTVGLHSILVQDVIYIFKRQLANLRDIRHRPLDYVAFIAAKAAFVAIVLLLPMALLPVPWWQVLLAYAISTMAMSLLFVFTLIGTHFADTSVFPEVQHDGSITGSFVGNTFATSLDWNPTGFWATHLIGGLNAHVAHHLFPKVCHMHYRAISHIIARLAAHYGIVYHRTNLRGMIAAHFRLLRRLGQPPLASSMVPA